MFDPFEDGYGCKKFFKHLRENLPDVFTRETASKMTGDLFSARTLSNIDSSGKGPMKRVFIGTKVLYEKNSFVDWLENKMLPQKRVQRKKILHKNQNYFDLAS